VGASLQPISEDASGSVLLSQHPQAAAHFSEAGKLWGWGLSSQDTLGPDPTRTLHPWPCVMALGCTTDNLWLLGLEDETSCPRIKGANSQEPAKPRALMHLPCHGFLLQPPCPFPAAGGQPRPEALHVPLRGNLGIPCHHCLGTPATILLTLAMIWDEGIKGRERTQGKAEKVPKRERRQ
jgi:hypothetical protein